MSLRQKLLKNKCTLGSWITCGHELMPDLFSNIGLDWLVIDLEHSSITLSEASVLIDKIKLSSMEPWVRLPCLDAALIKKCLDFGATGLILPMVQTKQEAQKFIEASLYPPQGRRGVALYKANQFGDDFANYTQEHNKTVSLILQIETAVAVENIDDILSLNRIDGLLIGPYDLSASLGVAGNFKSPPFKKALKKITLAAKKRKISLGYHVTEASGKAVEKKLKEGFSFVALSTDCLILKSAAKAEMAKISRRFFGSV